MLKFEHTADIEASYRLQKLKEIDFFKEGLPFYSNSQPFKPKKREGIRRNISKESAYFEDEDFLKEAWDRLKAFSLLKSYREVEERRLKLWEHERLCTACKHYADTCPVRLKANNLKKDEAKLFLKQSCLSTHCPITKESSLFIK